MTMHFRRHDDVAPKRFPWEEGHASVEDRALGLELELIELVQQRRTIHDRTDPEVARLTAEISAVTAELDHLSELLPLAG